jgi:hypothetical protein
MHVFNEHKLLNVRVSKPAFEYIIENAPYVEDKIPSGHGKIESPLKGHVAICMVYHVERMITHVSEKSLSGRITPDKERHFLYIRYELSTLYAELKKQKAIFAYVMVE